MDKLLLDYKRVLDDPANSARALELITGRLMPGGLPSRIADPLSNGLLMAAAVPERGASQLIAHPRLTAAFAL